MRQSIQSVSKAQIVMVAVSVALSLCQANLIFSWEKKNSLALFLHVRCDVFGILIANNQLIKEVCKKFPYLLENYLFIYIYSREEADLACDMEAMISC